ncbi:MAG: hypothetical protein K2Z81_15960, partial [Cyanobacteria bacterium]|nr:hypothetical protein [Cyanobacteriota bacterium]
AAFDHPKAQSYGQFLRLAAENNLPQMITLMSRMSDHEGAQMVFDELITRTGANPEVRQNVLREALGLVPSLRSRALNMVSAQTVDPQMERALWRLSQSQYDRELASRAAAVLERVQLNGQMERINTLARGSEASQNQALDLAAGVTEYSVIRPLLQISVDGSSSTASRAAELLRQFNPTVIRHYVREGVRTGAITDSQAQRLWNP